MLKSIGLYSKYFLKTLASKSKRSYLIHDFNCIRRDDACIEKQLSYDEKMSLLGDSVDWLLQSQKKMDDDGIGSYHLVNGWTSSYPETTGYIIPTLIEYAIFSGREKILQNVTDAANWLVKMQKLSGGWQGGKVAENKPEIVFNTAQIIRGLLSIYELGKDEIYLNAAFKAGKWLCSVQHPQGYWKTNALMNQARVYDSYVDVPLIRLFNITENELFRDCAIRNLEWIIHEKQKNNGWFYDCDNTQKRNDKPIVHTIAYTIDGLLNSGLLLNEEKYIKSAQMSADTLLDIMMENNSLNGRYDEDWNGSEYPMTTAYAQMAYIWLLFCKLTNDRRYWEAASMANSILLWSLRRPFREIPETKGALSGSMPLWGKYEPFAFPNWATKYFIDSLMLELKLSKQA